MDVVVHNADPLHGQNRQVFLDIGVFLFLFHIMLTMQPTLYPPIRLRPMLPFPFVACRYYFVWRDDGEVLLYLLGVVLVSSKTIMSLFSPLTPLMSIYLLVQLVDNLVYRTLLLLRKMFRSFS